MLYDVRQSVMDALDACCDIQEFTKEYTLESYQADRPRRLSVERLFEILGEAFKRIDVADPLFRNHLPEMGEVIGMRNRLVHGYDVVDDETVWATVKENVPALMAKLTEWLNENP